MKINQSTKVTKCLEDLPNYHSQSVDESYMNANQIEHFKNKLIAWKLLIQDEIQETMQTMRENESQQVADSLDRASQEHTLGIELKTRNREYKLIKKIDEALTRIEFGDYGYCKITGDEIGIDRLDARPTSDLCIRAKSQLERNERNL